MIDTCYHLVLACDLKAKRCKLSSSKQDSEGIRAKWRVFEGNVDSQPSVSTRPDDDVLVGEGDSPVVWIRNLSLYSQPIGTRVSTDSQDKNLVEVLALHGQGGRNATPGKASIIEFDMVTQLDVFDN